MNHALFDLLKSLLSSEVNTELYDAKMAGIDYSITTVSSLMHLPILQFHVEVTLRGTNSIVTF